MTHGYLVFRVGREWYGLPVEAVVEVLHLVALNEVPGTDILGVMTLRGQAIKVFDLRQRFGISNPKFELDTPIMVINTPRGDIGFVVDGVDDVIQVAEDNISPYQDGFIESAVRVNGRMFFVVEPGRVVEKPVA